ncbi:MAG: hypothetical protein DDT19_02104 [Syntrophomonadaceae bacterium]|nr:hypothetical protein [Bacillota bacterium]
MTSQSADMEIKAGLRGLRARCRELERNNDYARKFLKLCVVNVVGPSGITMQNKARDANGVLDTLANTKIEEAWSEWGKKENCDIAKELSWVDMQRLFVETVARDGEVIVRKIPADNKFKFSLQLLEADHLDENYNQYLNNGNRIRMGIEFDKWQRRVAYHLFVKHPGDYGDYMRVGNKYERIPADEIIHCYIKERPSQTRGVPWMHSAMTRLNMLGAYEEAELVASRIGASKMGFYETPTGTEYIGEDIDSGNLIKEVEPGVFEQLPRGVTVKTFDPQHPPGNFQTFMKTVLRGIASGLLVSYNSLASDLEATSYSSIRAGSLEERDMWRVLQNWMVNNFCNEVFSSWLKMALLTQTITLPSGKFDKFNVPKWQVRGWQWVDPLKDVKSNIEAIQFGLKTRQMIAGEQGYDIEDIFEQLLQEKQLMEKMGLIENAVSDKIVDDELVKTLIEEDGER